MRDKNPSLLRKLFLKIRRKWMAYMPKEKWIALDIEYNRQRGTRRQKNVRLIRDSK